MTTKNPRIQVMISDNTNAILSALAKQQKRSISATAALLIEEALELYEDQVLSRHGDKRMQSATQWVSHEDAWK